MFEAICDKKAEIWDLEQAKIFRKPQSFLITYTKYIPRSSADFVKCRKVADLNKKLNVTKCVPEMRNKYFQTN